MPQDLLVQTRRPRVAPRRPERLREEVVDLLVAPRAAVLPDQRRRADQERALQGGVARVVRLLEKARDDVVPLLFGLLDLLERFLDVRVAGAQLEGAGVRALRASIVEQLLAMNPAELPKEIRGAVRLSVGGEPRLHVEDLRHRAILRAGVVSLTRAIQQARIVVVDARTVLHERGETLQCLVVFGILLKCSEKVAKPSATRSSSPSHATTPS